MNTLSICFEKYPGKMYACQRGPQFNVLPKYDTGYVCCMPVQIRILQVEYMPARLIINKIEV